MIEENDLNRSENENQPIGHKQSLGTGQKIAVFSLAVFAILVIGMWMVQFKKSISGPFDYSANTNNSNLNEQVAPEEEDSEESLRNKDTDGDGLSDWDELYLYKTSPYLEDSDSDGFSDKEEIDSENDPSCPIGRDCYGPEIIEDSDDLNADDINNLVLPEQPDIPTDIQDIGQLDAATIRQMLLEAGMDANMLNQFSDEELIEEWGKSIGGLAQ